MCCIFVFGVGGGHYICFGRYEEERTCNVGDSHLWMKLSFAFCVNPGNILLNLDSRPSRATSGGKQCVDLLLGRCLDGS